MLSEFPKAAKSQQNSGIDGKIKTFTGHEILDSYYVFSYNPVPLSYVQFGFCACCFITDNPP